MILCFAAALVAGALNSVAGGGSFLTLPALLYAGVPPVAANATSTFALWPGMVATSLAYRRDMAAVGRGALEFSVISFVGGLLGAVLLIRTSDTSFMRLLPWLMLMASVTFTFGARLAVRVRQHVVGQGREPSHPTHGLPVWAWLIQLVIAIYGGYFGGGIGMMMLAGMALAGMADIHQMNALKSVLALSVNAIALAIFIFSRIIDYRPGVIMMAAAICGGYVGASVARRLPSQYVRGFVIAVGWTLTAYFFVR